MLCYQNKSLDLVGFTLATFVFQRSNTLDWEWLQRSSGPEYSVALIYRGKGIGLVSSGFRFGRRGEV